MEKQRKKRGRNDPGRRKNGKCFGRDESASDSKVKLTVDSKAEDKTNGATESELGYADKTTAAKSGVKGAVGKARSLGNCEADSEMKSEVESGVEDKTVGVIGRREVSSEKRANAVDSNVDIAVEPKPKRRLLKRTEEIRPQSKFKLRIMWEVWLTRIISPW